MTFKFLVVVSPPTPNVAMVAIPVTFKLVKLVLLILISVTVKIPTKPVVAVIKPMVATPVIFKLSISVCPLNLEYPRTSKRYAGNVLPIPTRLFM